MLVLCLVAACGGGSSGDECRSTDDCGGELGCSGVNDGPVCGIGPREECATDDACGGGNVCHVIGDSCSADGIGSTCGPPCIEENDCEASLTCDAGHCVAIRCDEGFACAGRQECDPDRFAVNTPAFDRHHGCFAVACSDDAECGERFCVNGTCQDAPGRCVEPILVP